MMLKSSLFSCCNLLTRVIGLSNRISIGCCTVPLLFAGMNSLQAQEYAPNSCSDSHFLYGDMMASTTSHYVFQFCGDGLDQYDEYFFGFYAGSDFLLSIDFELGMNNDIIFFNEAVLYGPFDSNMDGCSSLGTSNEVISYVHNDLLTSNPLVQFGWESPLNEGYYILRFTFCYVENLSGTAQYRLIMKNNKSTGCRIPCDLMNCDDEPCDTYSPDCWYPLVCDSCSVFGVNCDDLPGGGTGSSPCDNVITSEEEIDCPTCIGRFAPLPGERYMFEAWVREEDATPLSTHYENPRIVLRFYDGFDALLGSESIGVSGPIIEGWQQISEAVEIPPDATTMEMELYVVEGQAYYDDIRVSPFNSSMKTFVYDRQNMRMVAELDKRNFATFYQYDDEGRMVAVKKETERGIKTIRSIQQNTSVANVD